VAERITKEKWEKTIMVKEKLTAVDLIKAIYTEGCPTNDYAFCLYCGWDVLSASKHKKDCLWLKIEEYMGGDDER